MTYPADPGGWFASDVHRRVLGHLAPPHEPYAWTAKGLFNRMIPDGSTNLQSVDEIQTVLQDLERDGHAARVSAPDGREVWAMTQDGFKLLTGGIKNEPPPGAAVQGPAMIGDTDLAAVMLQIPDTNVPEGAEPAQPQETPQTQETGDAGSPS